MTLLTLPRFDSQLCASVRTPSLAAHHHVVITDAAIRAAIELTDIWVPDRRRPDKAIDALERYVKSQRILGRPLLPASAAQPTQAN